MGGAVAGAEAESWLKAAAPRKEARIPQPWRLQLSMPRDTQGQGIANCKYFLRMDVSRSTSLRDIR